MFAQLLLFFILNIFGLDLSIRVASKELIVISQLFMISFGFYFNIYKKILSFNTIKKDIYFLSDTVQVDVLYTLQLVFVVRSLLNYKLQASISKSLSFKVQQRYLIKYFSCLIILIIVRVLKFHFVSSPEGREFMMKSTFAELTLSISDFQFEFYISLLIENLRDIKKSLKFDQTNDESLRIFNKTRQAVLHNFSVKKNIQRRYSLEVMMTVVYNFLQLLIALYYIFMRAQYHYLGSLLSNLSEVN